MVSVGDQWGTNGSLRNNSLGCFCANLLVVSTDPKVHGRKASLARVPSPRVGTAWLEQLTLSLCAGAPAMYHLCDPGCVAVVQSIIPTLVDGHHHRQLVGAMLDQPSDGVDLRPSSPAPHLVAVLSAKNVKWMGSHRPVGKLESLADRIAADSAIPSPASAVTPRSHPE